MRIKRTTLVWLLWMAGGAMAGSAAGQEGSPFPKAGKEHEILARDVGNWAATIKTWSSPEASPEVWKGTETNTLMPGGLWLLSKFEGKFGGTPFFGSSQNGYDTHKKKYVSHWVDSMSTSPLIMEGTHDAATDSLTMVGDSVDPAGNKGQMRIVTTYRRDGTRHAQFYMKPGPDAKEFKMMEIEYTKANP